MVDHNNGLIHLPSILEYVRGGVGLCSSTAHAPYMHSVWVHSAPSIVVCTQQWLNKSLLF